MQGWRGELWRGPHAGRDFPPRKGRIKGGVTLVCAMRDAGERHRQFLMARFDLIRYQTRAGERLQIITHAG